MTRKDRELAIEAARELERLGNVARSVAESVPLIVSPDRKHLHRLTYDVEADRLLCWAKAVRACAERVDVLDDDWQDHCGDKSCDICGEPPENKDHL